MSVVAVTVGVSFSLNVLRTSGWVNDTKDSSRIAVSLSPIDEKEEGWNPRFFERANISTFLARDLNFIHDKSGCFAAAWIFENTHRKKFVDCYWSDNEQRLNAKRVHEMEPYDTVYVTYKSVGSFLEKIMPNVTVPIILLTGQHYMSSDNLLPKDVTDQILDHPNIVFWFVHNMNEYIQMDDKPPDKVKPLAYGLQSDKYTPKSPDPRAIYRHVFLRHLELNKTRDILIPYLNPHTNPKRMNIPRSTERVDMETYLEQLAGSHFIFSPNGDRPECYRHYEALGLGAIPITELDPIYYWHLKSGPVVYNTTNWHNLTTGDDVLQLLGLDVFPRVQRNMVFAEYWLEQMERVVGRALRWWDTRYKKRTYLDDFGFDWDLATRLSTLAAVEEPEKTKSIVIKS
jgi:hypothetical protein